MQFIRKRNDLGGSYNAWIGKKKVRIEGRSVYTTDDKAEIEVLKNDPEIEVVKSSKSKNKTKK